MVLVMVMGAGMLAHCCSFHHGVLPRADRLLEVVHAHEIGRGPAGRGHRRPLRLPRRHGEMRRLSGCTEVVGLDACSDVVGRRLSSAVVGAEVVGLDVCSEVVGVEVRFEMAGTAVGAAVPELSVCPQDSNQPSSEAKRHRERDSRVRTSARRHAGSGWSQWQGALRDHDQGSRSRSRSRPPPRLLPAGLTLPGGKKHWQVGAFLASSDPIQAHKEQRAAGVDPSVHQPAVGSAWQVLWG